MSVSAAACQSRIAERNPAIRAFVHVDPAASDGMPVAIKDNIAVAGMPCAAGIEAWQGRRAERDAEVVQRLRRAGVAILGKTNMHEGALGATTDNAAFGRCDNPLHPGFSPGGSSGGSAAAVADGMTRLALGTDTMGSVRIPASFCGVLGLKPTRGLLPLDGIVPLAPSLDHVGLLAASTEDLATGLGLLTGRPAHRRPVAGLVLGRPVQVDQPGCEPAIVAAFDAAVAFLAARGAIIRAVDIADWDPGTLRRAALLVTEVEAAACHADLLFKDGISPAFRAALSFGQQARPDRVALARRVLARAEAGLAGVWDHVNAVLTPTTPQTAFPHGAVVPANLADFTVLANVAGVPALSVPWATPGRPAGIQIMAPMGAEPLLVDFASLASGARAARSFATSHPQLDVLVNNAGIIAGKRERSVDGHELTWATNFLGLAAFTRALLPTLEATPGARIVNVGSSAQNVGRIPWDDIELERGYTRQRAYARSKLAVTLWTRELARRHPGVLANVVHPGTISTNILRSYGGIVRFLAARLLPSAEKGAAPIVRLATSDDVAGVTGRYFDKLRDVAPAPAAQNEVDAARIWTYVDRTLG